MCVCVCVCVSLYQTLVQAGGSVGIYFKNITRCKQDWDWSVGMLSLRGVIHGTTDRVSHNRLRPGHGKDAIIGTDVLGSVLPHSITLDIKNGLLFTDGGASLQLHRRDTALSDRVFTVGHCSVPPYSEAVLHCTVRTTGGRPMPSRGPHIICGKYRPCRGQNFGGSV